MNKITFYVGQGLKRDGTELTKLDLSVLRPTAFVYLMENFGAFTAIPTFGGWKNNV